MYLLGVEQVLLVLFLGFPAMKAPFVHRTEFTGAISEEGTSAAPVGLELPYIYIIYI